MVIVSEAQSPDARVQNGGLGGPFLAAKKVKIVRRQNKYLPAASNSTLVNGPSVAKGIGSCGCPINAPISVIVRSKLPTKLTVFPQRKTFAH
jgi:hypothetical protein